MQDNEYYSKILSGLENLYSKKSTIESSLVKEANAGFVNVAFVSSFLTNIKIIDEAIEYMEQMKKDSNISASLNKNYNKLFRDIISQEPESSGV